MAPTLTRGMVNSYSASVTGGSVPADLYIRDVPRMIEFMRRYDNPMLKLIKPGGSHDKLKWEFGSGDLMSRDDVTTGTHTNSTTTLNVTSGLKYQKWNVIRIPSTGEQMLVTAISIATMDMAMTPSSASTVIGAEVAFMEILRV